MQRVVRNRPRATREQARSRLCKELYATVRERPANNDAHECAKSCTQPSASDPRTMTLTNVQRVVRNRPRATREQGRSRMCKELYATVRERPANNDAHECAKSCPQPSASDPRTGTLTNVQRVVRNRPRATREQGRSRMCKELYATVRERPANGDAHECAKSCPQPSASDPRTGTLTNVQRVVRIRPRATREQGRSRMCKELYATVRERPANNDAHECAKSCTQPSASDPRTMTLTNVQRVVRNRPRATREQ